MPLRRIPRPRGWGYDGVQPFAVARAYGGPAALKRFVDACHAQGLAVVLDVVYNHLGPEGNYLRGSGRTSPTALDALGQASTSTGRAATRCAATSSTTPLHWVRDFHVDALRLDAVHAIVDTARRTSWRSSPRGARARPATRSAGRSHLIAESDLNDPRW